MAVRENLTEEEFTLLSEVAKRIAPGFTVARGGWQHSAKLVNAETGAELNVFHTDGRYVISGYAGESYLFTREQQEQGLKWHHEISVTDKKTAGQIAGDITRRLLTSYLASLEIAQAHAAKVKADQDARRAALEALSAYSDDSGVVDDREGHATQVSIRYHSELPYGDFKVSTYRGLHYKVELDNVSQELAAQILALVAANR